MIGAVTETLFTIVKRDNERREESEITREREGSSIVPGRVVMRMIECKVQFS